MKKTKENMRKLIEQRERLQAELEALKNKIAGLDMAIKLIDGGDGEPDEQAPRHARRGNVKGILLDLLDKSGDKGLNAASAVEMASFDGIDLDRGSVSSLLSRLKRDGIAKYDGDKYTLVARRPTIDELLG